MIIFFLFVIVLAVGIKIYIKSEKEKENFELYVEIKFLFLKIYSRRISKNKESQLKDKKDLNKSSNKLTLLRETLPLIKNNLFKIAKLLTIFIKSIKLEKLNGNIVFGFYSPVNTAISFANVNNIFTILNFYNKCNLNVKADFTKEIFDFNTELVFQINLLKLFIAFSRFLTSKSGFKLINHLRKYASWIIFNIF
ncbi:MAG: hypothetical protein LBV42_03450 [Methanobrevibacter sp.]|nr:hypothetical protein [Methanobrevibacter sp.]